MNKKRILKATGIIAILLIGVGIMLSLNMKNNVFAEVYAPGTLTLSSESKDKIDYITLNNGETVNTYLKKTIVAKKEVNVYCIQGFLQAPNVGDPLANKGSLYNAYPGLGYILNNPYTAFSGSEAERKNYYVTQLAIWWYMDDKDDEGGYKCPGGVNAPGSCYYNLSRDVKNNNVRSDQYGMISKAKKLMQEAKNHEKKGYYGLPTFDVSASPNTWTNDGEYFISSAISFIATENIYKTVDFQLKNAPSGTVLIDSSGKTIENKKIPKGTTFRIKVPIASVKALSAKFSLALNTTGTVYEAFRYSGTNTDLQDITPGYVFNNVYDFKEDLNFNISQTAVEFVKRDKQTGENLAGATIELRDEGGSVVESWVTTTGSYTIYGLTPGKTYTFKEIKAPDGYKLLRDTFRVTPESGKLVIAQTIQNERMVEILKKDSESKKPLEGAHLILREKNGNRQIDEWDTTSSSHQVSGLSLNTVYVIEETTVPDGYVKMDNFEFTYEGDGKVIEVYNEPSKLSITKVDEEGNPLAGAHLKLKDSHDNVKDEWDTTTDPHIIKKLKLNETYTIEETKAPKGYVVQEAKQFTFDTNNKTVQFENAKTQITIQKVDATSRQPVAGAQLVLMEKGTNTKIDSWTSTLEPHPVYGIELNKEYTIEELEAPDGYVVSESKDITVTSNNETFEFENEKTAINIAKVDKDNHPVSGAHLVLIEKEGNRQIDSWVSDTTPHVVRGLVLGHVYIIRETISPSGYKTISDKEITFTGNNQTINVENNKTKVSIIKRDADTRQPVAGAQLVLKDKESGSELYNWTSTKDPYVVEGLELNKEYIVEEKEAPSGYKQSANITFTVDNTDQTVYFDNTLSGTKIIKVDKETGEMVSGAHLVLKDANDVIKDEWDTTLDAHIVRGLNVGENYKIEETKTPKGYKTADFKIFQFTDEDQTVRFENEKIKTSIQKVDADNPSQLVAGAELCLKDKDGGGVIECWTSATTPHVIKGLEIGKTYTIEEKKAPNGYLIHESKDITIASDSQTFSFENSKTIAKFAKVDQEGKTVTGAHLVLKTSHGDTIAEWDTTSDPYVVKGLTIGENYVIEETVTPSGYKVKIFDPFEYDGTDKVINFVNEKTKTTIIKVDAETGEPIAGATLKLTNKATGESKNEWTWVTTLEPYVIYGLEVGQTYILSEEKAPDGYVIGASNEIKIRNEDIEWRYKNSKTVVKIAKVDKDTDEYVSGAHLVLKDSKGTIIDEWDTVNEPHIISGLTIGEKYSILETVTPDGYIPSEYPDFIFTGEDEIIKLVNEISKVSILKVDSTSGNPLAGAHLILKDSEGNIIDEWDSTIEPHLITKKLVLNEKYTLLESKAPDGYIIGSQKQFVFDKNNIEITYQNSSTAVKIHKVDKDSKEFVIGAHLVLKDSKGNIVDEWDTVEEIHSIAKLIVGETYTIEETKTPNGYQSLKEPVTFTVTGIDQTIMVYNEIINPSTGDFNVMYLVIGLVAISGVALISYRKIHLS